MGSVLVGVDGSTHGDAALDFALEEAALRRLPLRVVCAWDITPLEVAGGVMPPRAFESSLEQAQLIVNEALRRASLLHPAVACEGRAPKGRPAGVLLEEAHDAVMIVVGSRGRGGFASLLLGSVSQEVVRQASCPVCVVR